MNPVRCTKCRTVLPVEFSPDATRLACPRCRASLEVSVFPAIQREIGPGIAAHPALVEGETTCFFHAEKKAVVLCDGCGRFLCALCDVPIGGQHLCPKCLETSRAKNTLTTLENYRTLYPSLALTFAFLPLLVWPLTVLTAPAALFLVFYGWRKPASLTGRRRRFAMIVAGLAALAQCVGWAAAFFGIYQNITRG